MTEFALAAEALDDLGIRIPEGMSPRRVVSSSERDSTLSALLWGSGSPNCVYLHGGGQNAHTWDALIALLRVPAIAVDLPGHGHSAWRDDRDYRPHAMTEALASVVTNYASAPVVLVGSSLGGLAGLALAAARPDLVRHLVLVDVLPGTLDRGNEFSRRQLGAVSLVHGRREFESLEEMVEAAVLASPHRPHRATRRGVIHNSIQQSDGRWRWRYDKLEPERIRAGDTVDRLWRDLGRAQAAMTLVRGGRSRFVSDTDLVQLRSVRPDCDVRVVEGAGHSVQGDRPLELASLLRLLVQPR